MVAVTYGVAPAVESKSAVKQKSVFTMLFEAIAASQMKRAEREVARYKYMVTKSEDEPFAGW